MFSLCACAKENDVRVIELENGTYTVQVYDGIGDWKWLSRNGQSWYGALYAIERDLLTFSNEVAACDYREELSERTNTKRIIECE